MKTTPLVLARRRSAAAILLGCVAVAALLLAPPRGHGQDAPGAIVVQTDLGLPLSSVAWLGAPSAGAPGEVEAVGGGGAFFRHTDAAGWTPLGRVSVPGQGPRPTSTAQLAGGVGLGSVTPHGGLVDLRTDADTYQTLIAVADPGAGAGEVHALPPPVDGDPADPAAPSLLPSGTALYSYPSASLAPIDEPSGHTGVLLAPTPGGFPSSGQVTTMLHWDPDAVSPTASGWSAEPIDGAGAHATLVPVAVAAAARDDAWLVARSDDGDGVLLYRREVRPAASGGTHWVAVDLSGTVLGARDPADAVVTPKAQPDDALAVTDHGLWIDAGVTRPGDARPSDLATHLDAAGHVDGSWCDVQVGGAPLCAHGLGVTFGSNAGPTQVGYQIVAFDPAGGGGSGPGTRITSNAGAGTYVRFDGERWTRLQGTGDTARVSAAFFSLDDGWLGGDPPRRVSTGAPTPPLQAVPVAARRPLLAAAPQPRHPAGALDAQAVAVGVDGSVVRYVPGRGWAPEALREPGSDARDHVTLRAVAWPAPDYAVAVGDGGAVYSWTPQRGTWTPDEARPDDLGEALTGVAFDPANPDRGYVVGRNATLLRYDKTLEPDPLPADVHGDDLVAVAFAGRDALVAATTVATDAQTTVRPSDLLVNAGAGWHVDPQIRQLLEARPGATINAVAGLPDGGAFVAGHDFAAYRDGPGADWTAVLPPGPDRTPVALAAFREDGHVRALMSVTTAAPYPHGSAAGTAPSPDVPAPARGPLDAPSSGYLLRQTATGWRDEQHAVLYQGFGRPLQPDGVLALGLVGADATGWLVGGDEPGDPASADGAAGETAAIFRYPHDDRATAQQQATSATALPAGPARFVVAGGGECGPGCWAYPNLGLEGDVMLSAARRTADQLAARPHGPRAFLYTGAGASPGKIGETQLFPARDSVAPSQAADLQHYAQRAGAGVLPFYAAPSAGELGTDGTLSGFSSAFAGFPAPFGTAAAPGGVAPVALPGDPAPAAGARTHYAFDSQGDGGTVRVVVVDLSGSSAHGSDAWQNPAQAQDAWVAATLDDAKAHGIPAIVMGNAPLQPGSAGDVRNDWQQVTGNADLVAFGRLMADHGASAYFFESLDQNRFFYAPSGSDTPIPTWGTGTLNRGLTASEAGNGVRHDLSGELLVEVDGSRRDATTNRAPVNVRLIPLVEDLAIDALDGTTVARGRTALFTALARRPRSGGAAGTNAYLPIPSPSRCPGTAGCATKVDPEYSFSSSDPEVGDFVATDPASADPRSVLIGTDGKPVADPRSALFCGYNPGTTTVSVEAGGLAYSEAITVSGGSPRRPCGTVPLSAAKLPRPPAIVQVAASPSAPSAAPAGSGPPPSQPSQPPAQPVATPAPPPPAAVAPPVAPPHVAPPAHAAGPPAAPPAGQPLVAAPPGRVIGALPPPPPTSARPSPPSGTAPVQVSAFANVPAAREEREEEAAPEDVQAASAYRQTDAAPTVPLTLAVLVIAAAAGTGVRRARGGGRPVLQPAPVETDGPPRPTRRTR